MPDTRSIGTDRQYLLSTPDFPPRSYAPSIAPSEASFALPAAADIPTNRFSLPASSTILPPETPQPSSSQRFIAVRRSYDSEEDYLQALSAWVKEKEYAEISPHALTGWYGKETSEAVVRRLQAERAQRKSKRGKGKQMEVPEAVKENESENGSALTQRQTVAGVQSVEAGGEYTAMDQPQQQGQKKSRRRSLGNWLARRRSAL